MTGRDSVDTCTVFHDVLYLDGFASFVKSKHRLTDCMQEQPVTAIKRRKNVVTWLSMLNRIELLPTNPAQTGAPGKYYSSHVAFLVL